MMNHPALYAYHLKDEPEVNDLPGLGELVKKIKTIDSIILVISTCTPIGHGGKSFILKM